MDVRRALSGSLLPAADAEVLLSRALHRDRSWLLAHPDETLSDAVWTTFSQWVGRRRTCEPVAYIVGEQEFYGRPFSVDKRVLIPRPSTEGLIASILKFLADGIDSETDVDSNIVAIARTIGTRRAPTVIIDVGTGSGCIAVTLALELPTMKIIATDISADALEVAKENAKRHGVENRIDFRQGSGSEPLEGITETFLLVSNPPYIPAGKILMKDVADHEPHVALFGGNDGTSITKEIVTWAKNHPQCVGFAIECEKDQVAQLSM